MSNIRRCDRCTAKVDESAGSEIVLRDRATFGVTDYDGAQPSDEQVLDLCSICRTDLGEFLGITGGRPDEDGSTEPG